MVIREARRSREGLAATFIVTLIFRLAIAAMQFVVAPQFLSLLGRDGYGLVGLYLAAQAWMVFFDLGMAQAVLRQLARYRAGAVPAAVAASLLAVTELLFVGFALALVCGVVSSAPAIQAKWLGESHLAPREIRRALVLIGGCLALRWLSTFYQTALQGLERTRVSGGLALFGALVRTGLSLILVLAVRRDASDFFLGQLAGAAIEIVASKVALLRAQPEGAIDLGRGVRSLRLEFGFAVSVAASLILSTLTNETDKLVLSHRLPLAELGLCSLVWTLCSAIRLATPPLAQVVQPRLVRLLAENDRTAFIALYRTLKAAFLVLVGSVSGALAVLPGAALFAWTGDRGLAAHMAPVLAAYAAATGVTALLMPPFLLQFAFGKTNFQFVGNLWSGAVIVPAVVISAVLWQAIGAGLALLVGNLAYLVIWIPIVERRFLTPAERSGDPRPWAIPLAAMIAGLVVCSLASPLLPSRLGSAALVAGTALSALLLGGVSSAALRGPVFAFTRLGLAGLRNGGRGDR
jgi:O-antigen/teichoic acid export membrane protein